MNANQVVYAMLEAVIEPEGVGQLTEKIREIAAHSKDMESFIAAANEFLAAHGMAYDSKLQHGGFFNRRNQRIFLRYPSSLQTAAIEFERCIEHELIHREQFKRSGNDMGHVKPLSKTTNIEYMTRPHELMAFANNATNDLKRSGLSREQIKQKMRSGQFNPDSEGLSFYFSAMHRDPRFAEVTGATPKQRKGAKRFFKNVYSYVNK